jgi:4-hydroxybenzoate polyprenyltransferase
MDALIALAVLFVLLAIYTYASIDIADRERDALERKIAYLENRVLTLEESVIQLQERALAQTQVEARTILHRFYTLN